MNDRFDLRIITQPHSQVYWGYFRRLVFGNSSTKHNKLTYFSNSMLFCSDVLLPFSHIPRCIHAKTPDFPRLFEPREITTEYYWWRSIPWSGSGIGGTRDTCTPSFSANGGTGAVETQYGPITVRSNTFMNILSNTWICEQSVLWDTCSSCRTNWYDRISVWYLLYSTDFFLWGFPFIWLVI